MLPITPHLQAVAAAAVDPGAFVVVAPPGSGKTLGVPPALLDAGFDRVLVSQPRRVAARLVARHLARLRGGRVGGEVGFSTRFERSVGPGTRIEFITDGLLVRRLQADPFLEGVGAVLLDEFHERSVAGDLALAMLAELRRDARPELALGVLSATLDPAPVAAFLGGAVIEAPGRMHPVELRWAARPSRRPIAEQVASAVRRAVAEEPGHVLAFLPGVREIDEAARELADLPRPVRALHGRLPSREQDAALAPGPPRVVLSTNIAETSVTLDGVTAVVDSGLARVARYDPAADATRLLLEPIPRASADQRAGRAGRTAPGRCWRLWTEAEHRARPAQLPPALHRSELASVLLQVWSWAGDPDGLRWLDPPRPGAWRHARELLLALGAADERGLTERGRQLAELPVSPRLGRVLQEGRARGVPGSAAAAVALLSERDPWRDPPAPCHDEASDLLGRLVAFAGWEAGGPAFGASRGALRELVRVRDQLLRLPADGPTGGPATGRCPPLVAALLAGMPDRVAQRRGRGARLLLASGSGARLNEASTVAAPLLLAASMRAGPRGREPLVDLATPLEESWLQTEPHEVLRWDGERVVASRQDKVGAIVLREASAAVTDRGAASAVLEEALRAAPHLLPVDDQSEQLRHRVAFLAAARPDLDLPKLEAWSELLPSLCVGRRALSELSPGALRESLRGTLSWSQQQALDRFAPSQLDLPTGRPAPLIYDGEAAPVLAARIQQLFGLVQTPTVAGRPVTLHLLAPNGRPQQVTQDLASFWTNGYPEVRKELRGRYPKHPWPEDPTTAPPTDRAKRRR